MRLGIRVIAALTFWVLVLSRDSAATPSTDKLSELAEKAKSQKVAEHLTRAGFENVAVLRGERLTLVTYENRIYRYEVRAIKEILDLVVPDSMKRHRVVLIPQHRKIPLVVISVPSSAYRALRSGEISSRTFAANVGISLDVEPAWGILQGVEAGRSSLYKVDLLVHPGFGAQFGNFEDPVESQINLTPELTTSFWKGMKLSAQVMIPLHNELGQERGRIAPHLITVNQTFRFLGNTFVSATAGYFTHNRYGLDLEMKKFFDNGLWSMSASIGYTGSATYANGGYVYSGLDQLTGFLTHEMRFPRTDLLLRLSVGRYLYQDHGMRVDFVRRFGEFDLSFFALMTQDGRNGGLAFSIPLFPRKYLSPKRIRISPARSIAWEYRYRGLQQGGLRYETANDLNVFMKRLTPDYLRNQFISFGGWAHGRDP